MTNTKNILFGLLISSFLLLTSCGQKGDLYLPGQEKASLDEQKLQTLKTDSIA